jgi:hypothetical protein
MLHLIFGETVNYYEWEFRLIKKRRQIQSYNMYIKISRIQYIVLKIYCTHVIYNNGFM